jgi:predicted flap endonuclease-1-like 5' DNA nuclease
MKKLTIEPAKLLGIASVGFARILDRAFEESGATPKKQQTFAWRMFYRMTLPVSWTYSTIRNLMTRSRVQKIANEFRVEGKVIDSLTVDDKIIRESHAIQVLQIDLGELDAKRIGEVGSKHVARSGKQNHSDKRSSNRSTPFRLELDSALLDAPSIGPKTAKRFSAIGITTVRQFLALEPKIVAAQLNTSHIQADTVETWQAQARLACQIPRIYGHDAQILVACGFDSPEEVAQAEPEVVLSLVDEFVETPEAKFIVRGKRPDLDEVTNWVEWAAESRSLDAA